MEGEEASFLSTAAATDRTNARTDGANGSPLDGTNDSTNRMNGSPDRTIISKDETSGSPNGSIPSRVEERIESRDNDDSEENDSIDSNDNPEVRYEVKNILNSSGNNNIIHENNTDNSEGSAMNATQSATGSESKTEAEIRHLLEKIHSSQEERQRAATPCSGCGRRHHASRMPWTNSTSCNPVIGLDVDDEDFQNAEDDVVAEPHLLDLPFVFDNVQVNNLLLVAMNLSVAMVVGIYFDDKFLRLIHRHHHDLFPPPIWAQVVNFVFVVLVTFTSLLRFWRSVLTVNPD